MSESLAAKPSWHWLMHSAAIALVLILGIGFARLRLWPNRPIEHLAEVFGLWFGLALLAVLARRALPRLGFIARFALVFGCLHAVMVGLSASIAAVVCSLLFLSLGHRLMPALPASLKLLGGAAASLCALAWLLWVPMHHSAVYAALIVLIAIWLRVELRWALAQTVDAAKQLARILGEPEVPAWLRWLGVAMVAFVCTSMWLPTVMHDDIGYHLRLPSQLLELGYYRFDFETQLWALAPWVSDLWQGIVMVLSGEEARGAGNSLWTGLGIALFWQLTGALELPARARWLALLLWLSQPLMWFLGLSMQVELPTQTAMLALSWLCFWHRHTPGAPLCFGLGLGFLAALKVSNAMLALPLMLCWFWRGRERWWRVILVAALAGGSSYFFALLLTGNPFFPVAGQVIPGKFGVLFEANFPVGLDLAALWRMHFFPQEYYEAYSPTMGVQWLVLLPWLLLMPRRSKAFQLALVASAGAVLLFVMMNYMRYLLPALALLSAVLISGAYRDSGNARSTTQCLVLLLVAVNFLYARHIWVLDRGVVTALYLMHSDQLKDSKMPERAWSAELRAVNAPEGSLLLADNQRAASAWLNGRERSYNGYDWSTWPLIEPFLLQGDAPGLERILQAQGIEHLWLSSYSRHAVFDMLLKQWPGAFLYKQDGHRQWWQLPPQPLDLSLATNQAHELPIAEPYVRVRARYSVPCQGNELLSLSVEWQGPLGQGRGSRVDYTRCIAGLEGALQIEGDNIERAAKVKIAVLSELKAPQLGRLLLEVRPNPVFKRNRTWRLWHQLGVDLPRAVP
jgi:hypothetical protein